MSLLRCVTADLVDDFSDQVAACLTQFRQFGGRSSFCGPIRTIKTLEDNADVKSCLGRRGDGAVLVIDGGGSLRTALLGGMIATSAVKNGWAGIVVLGAVRDSVQLGRLPLGIKALGTVPAKSTKNGGATVDAAVEFGGVTFQPGHWLYSDEDGLLVAATPLHQV